MKDDQTRIAVDPGGPDSSKQTGYGRPHGRLELTDRRVQIGLIYLRCSVEYPICVVAGSLDDAVDEDIPTRAVYPKPGLVSLVKRS